MTPTPQEHAKSHPDMLPTVTSDDPSHDDPNRIVISGMSGLYPNAYNVKELSDILYNKINPISAENQRYKYNHPELAQQSGSVPDVEHFDAQFFKVHFRLAESMDPMSRKFLEHTYQAIYDAGVNPTNLSGKKVGVYVGSCFSETEKSTFYTALLRTGLGIMGCSKTMFANRVSYWLNAKGPSMSIDESCCSSTAALEQACLAINRGECEAAIVGGTYLGIHPHYQVHFGRIVKWSKDGTTKSFDEYADGCAKSEAINVLFLQKAKDALRIYADVIHVKTEFIGLVKGETGPQYGFYRNFNDTINFMKKFYIDANISPEAVEYVEAFGSASPETDKDELQVIEEIFCKNRDDTLLVGSVMSNIGYSEAASGISSIMKVLLGYHNGTLAGNLNCEHPRKDIAALREGRMRIVTDHQRIRRSYAAVNGISVTGVNSHVLLHGHYKPKDLNRYKCNIPYLVTISGRHEAAVENVFHHLKANPIDPEQLALFHNVHKASIWGHMGRGYIILQSNEEQNTVSLYERSEYYDDTRRPLWFVYSGMGSQWAGMGAQLMRIPVFAAAIERCQKALLPFGANVLEIITSPEDSIFNNILHSFVGIAAIQIGLTDVLRELGLVPDGIIGHSVGEMGCAYADGCLTTEEMILGAYSRGVVSTTTEFIHGSMAAVGLGYEQISKICPPNIEVACHNGPDSCTLSGPSEATREFITQLTAKGIFAKEVSCGNIAYHSRYISQAGPVLLKCLKEVFRSPKPRSARWLSTSVPQDKWNDPSAQLCSAEYFTNNLLSPVLFEETSRMIPNNAVMIEIAPHGLLQAILKRSLPSCKNISLTKRKTDNSILLLLKSIGELYLEGYNPNIQVLYPKVEMPVSTGTPFLSHLVKWEHSEKWELMQYACANRKMAAYCHFIVTLHDKENIYLQGNKIRGYVLHPFAATLVLVWDTFAMISGVPKKQLSVEFNDLHLFVQPVLHDRRQLKLSVAINRGTGNFEVLDGSSKVITGVITSLDSKDKLEVIKQSAPQYFNAEDIYQLLRHREYSYSDEFRSIESVDESFSEATLVWRDNWVTFIDGMLQMNVLRQSHHAVTVPTLINKLQINVQTHNETISELNVLDNKVLMNATYYEEFDKTRCGGVLMENIQYENLPPVNNNKMVLKKLEFISHFQSGLCVADSLGVFIQIVAENLQKDVLNVVGITNTNEPSLFITDVDKVLDNLHELKVKYQEVSEEQLNNHSNCFEDVDVILVKNLSTNDNVCQLLSHVLKRDQFVVNQENKSIQRSTQATSIYRVISSHSSTDDSKHQSQLQLIRWGPKNTTTSTINFEVHEDNDVLSLTRDYKNLKAIQQLIVTTPYPVKQNLKALISSWHQNGSKVHLVEVKNKNEEDFPAVSDIELVFNVLINGQLGGEYYLPVNDKAMLPSARSDNYNTLNIGAISESTPNGITVSVKYAGINNIDVKKATDILLSKENIDYSYDKYGTDFSGVTENGIRVMGIVQCGAASGQVCAQPELVWPVPVHWTLEDAATVPCAYIQAFYCLIIKGGLNKGMSVLVHGGSGALGQALINIAIAYNCEVFTTVGDMRKKHFLRKLFPALKDDHIGRSQDHTFSDMVLTATKGRGCDVIISNVKTQLKNTTIRCLADCGKCIDVSQLNNHDNFSLGMSFLSIEKSYITVDFSTMFAAENKKDIRAIHRMLSEGIAHGYVRPLSRVTFPLHEAPRAFRLLAASRHRGAVLLHLLDSTLKPQLKLNYNSHRSHLVVCGKGTFGLLFADRLVENGVKKLCVYAQKQYFPCLQYKIRSWKKLDVETSIFCEELNDKSDVVNLLNKAMSLGPLEGIYVALGDETENVQGKVISNLDTVSRQLCFNLRFFAVMNTGSKTCAKSVCYRRISDQLPATIITIPELKNDTNVDNWSCAVDAIEQALQSGHVELLAHTTNTSSPTLTQQILSLAEISVPESTTKNLTLEQLGVQNHKLQVISSFLRIQYNLSFDEEQISSFTLDTISDLERTVSEFPYKDTKDLSTFFNYVDSDELQATTDLVFLPTLVNNASLRIEEFDTSERYLCIVPGMEGHHERFRVMCARLKLPALVLQPGLDHPHETVTQTAHRYAQVLLKKTEIKNNFYLLGYETGVFVALELAAILEEHGLTGTVFCIGHGPDEFQKVLEDHLSEFKTKEQLQVGVLQHMYELMTEGDIAPLQEAGHLSQNIEVSVRCLLGKVSHSAQYAHALIEAALARIEQARRYTSMARPLRSRIVLLRAATTHPPSEQTSLQQYSSRPLSVYQLRAPLGLATTDLRCAAIINQNLDSTILENFATRNICDSYLLSSEMFVKAK